MEMFMVCPDLRLHATHFTVFGQDITEQWQQKQCNKIDKAEMGMLSMLMSSLS